MKNVIVLFVVYVLCMLMFTGIGTYLIIHFGPILWQGVLQGTTEVTQAITAGQIAR